MNKVTNQNGIPEIRPEDAKSQIQSCFIIDVRTKEEYNGELSHIAGSTLVTLGPDLSDFLTNGDRNQEILFVCKSGGRSSKATQQAIQLGYKNVVNLTGGMTAWNALKYPTKAKP
jgi:rhodanese-related sulfurtransferase